MPESNPYEVLIVGGGMAGLSAATFTARAGLDTVVVAAGESILKRNAHVENYLGFPAGINPRLLLEMGRSQATRNGADLRRGRVTRLEDVSDLDPIDGTDGGDRAGRTDRDETDREPRFRAVLEREETTEDDDGDGRAPETILAERVIATSWSDASYLDPVGADLRAAGSKTYVEDDGHGRTSVEGLYVAGRLAERYHQAIVAAGDGAETAITLIHDAEVPFYHDWIAPEGYFTDRGREVPPGCEEIAETERRARERESLAAMREYLAEPHGERQRTHPSLVDDDRGRIPEE
ncbi:FAD-binding protein [Halopenitus persicus]|uniref:FAD binding domain-containing protein n=1 Tax=Halopenitus persicus TaxID=1048396 RepID=A0A1H3HFL0_9EURY|nr:FAD-binding protein [Halopenitus persicus]SDY14257.1 FAD binding domain-containing protein [Halopenitus persicus]